MPQGSLRLEVAVPDKLVLDVETDSVQLPLASGYLGVLPGHAPLLAEVGTGVLTFVGEQGREEHLALVGGAAEISPDRVRILADRAERAPAIDRERARQALERANSRLQLQSLEIDVERAQYAVARARARLSAARNA